MKADLSYPAIPSCSFPHKINGQSNLAMFAMSVFIREEPKSCRMACCRITYIGFFPNRSRIDSPCVSPSAALAEARDITLYLNPLTRHFQQLEDTEFSESRVLLKPLMHVVCLIWSNSLYYCHSAKLIGKLEAPKNDIL